MSKLRQSFFAFLSHGWRVGGTVLGLALEAWGVWERTQPTPAQGRVVPWWAWVIAGLLVLLATAVHGFYEKDQELRNLDELPERFTKDLDKLCASVAYLSGWVPKLWTGYAKSGVWPHPLATNWASVVDDAGFTEDAGSAKALLDFGRRLNVRVDTGNNSPGDRYERSKFKEVFGKRRHFVRFDKARSNVFKTLKSWWGFQRNHANAGEPIARRISQSNIRMFKVVTRLDDALAEVLENERDNEHKEFMAWLNDMDAMT